MATHNPTHDPASPEQIKAAGMAADLYGCADERPPLSWACPRLREMERGPGIGSGPPLGIARQATSPDLGGAASMCSMDWSSGRRSGRGADWGSR